MEFNALVLNNQQDKDWGITDPNDGTIASFYGSDIEDPDSVSTSIFTDGSSDVLAETQATAVGPSTEGFYPPTSGPYNVTFVGRASDPGAFWTVELIRSSDNAVLTSVLATGADQYYQFSLGTWVFSDADAMKLRIYSSDGGSYYLARVDLEPRSSVPTVRWRVKLDKVDGLWDADVRDERFPNPGQDGEASGDLKDGGKSITLAGRVQALDLDALREGQRELMKAFDTDEHALFWGMRGADQLYIRARKTQKIDMPEQQANNKYERGYTITLRADDPRSYAVTEKSVELTIGAVAGGLRTRLIQTGLDDYPIAGSPHLRGYSGQSTSAGQIVAENVGTRRTYPVIEVYGPMEDPIITNATTDQALVWDGLVLADGDFIVVDTREGIILRGGVSEDYTGFSVVDSDFFWLEPGLNTLSVVPFSSGANARTVVRWRDAY